MSVRIYALAKELGIDNKDLLGICEKLGIRGKGSALASLDDDEVSKIRSHLDSSQAEPEPPKRSDIAPIREASPPALGRVKDVTPKAKPKVTEQLTTSVDLEPPIENPNEATVESDAEVAAGSPDDSGDSQDEEVAESKPSLPVAPSSVASIPSDSPSAPIRGAGLRGHMRSVRDLDQKKKGGAKPKAGGKTTGRKPVVRVAAMPEVKQPTASAGPKEKVQKPDIALPQEAIRDAMRKKAQSGSTAPLQDFTKSNTNPKGRRPKPGDNPAAAAGAAATPAGPLANRRRGAKKERGEKGEATGMGSTRQARPARRRNHRDDDRYSRRRHNRHRRSGPVANTAAPRKDNVVLELPCSVRSFSEAAGIPAVKACLTISKLTDGPMPNINSILSDDVVELLFEHFEIDNIEVKPAETLEEKLIDTLDAEDDPDTLEARPPVVTFLGHVDHGKTSLLDSLIGINVVSGEAGGITQHIRAYEIDKNGQKISFVDTPGHEAFTEMRARGANVTDIAVLVVAADDGIMPQTEEAISHAKAAGVPIIVALNKIDLPGANPDKALQDLAAHELLPSEWGGDIEVVRTSAIEGTGMDELLETILVTAELHEYKANPNRAAVGTCLEAEQQSDRGVIAKVIVQKGTLKVGDIVVCGSAHGRVKAMYNTLDINKHETEAGPSTPVNITGLDVAPGAGDHFYVLEDIADAREIAESRDFQQRSQALSGNTVVVSLEDFQQRLESGNLGVEEVVTLNLIIRADVKGSIEAIQKELGKIAHPEIRVNILQALVGGVTVADVRLAQASGAVIVGFNVVPDEKARSMADDLQVQIRRYEVIYKVADDIRATLEGRLKPEKQDVELGMAMVLRVFTINKSNIAGCRVMRGNIQRGCRVRLIRDSRVIGDYALETLKREKDDAKEVQRGMECGMKLADFNDIKEGDTLEAYKIEEVARKLD